MQSSTYIYHDDAVFNLPSPISHVCTKLAQPGLYSPRPHSDKGGGKKSPLDHKIFK